MGRRPPCCGCCYQHSITWLQRLRSSRSDAEPILSQSSSSIALLLSDSFPAPARNTLHRRIRRRKTRLALPSDAEDRRQRRPTRGGSMRGRRLPPTQSSHDFAPTLTRRSSWCVGAPECEKKRNNAGYDDCT